MASRMVGPADRLCVVIHHLAKRLHAEPANNSKLAAIFERASSFSALVGMAVDVVAWFMALLSFVESAPRAYWLKAGNAASPIQHPAGQFLTAAGVRVKDLSHQRCLETLVERMNYAVLRDEQVELRKKGIHRGVEIAAFIKGTAPGPHGYYGVGGAPIASQDACTIKLDPGGGIVCAVGVTEQGQGVETVMAQIAASVLGVPMGQMRIISGDTGATPYGGGTYASRATAVGGEAVFLAAHDLRTEILSIAAVLLQSAPSTLDILDGHVVDAGTTTKRNLACRDRPHRAFPARGVAQQRATRAVGHAPVPPR